MRRMYARLLMLCLRRGQLGIDYSAYQPVVHIFNVAVVAGLRVGILEGGLPGAGGKEEKGEEEKGKTIVFQRYISLHSNQLSY